MAFEPDRLFIGVMDFFAILLPGAVLTYELKAPIAPLLNTTAIDWNLTEPEGFALFFVCSYLVGHLVFLIGAWLLDEVYDRLRSRTQNAQIARLAGRGTIMRWPIRAIVALAFKRERNRPVDAAGRIKSVTLATPRGAGAVNTFQWAKTWLSLESPAALASVQRFEADSKFFRSLVIVLMMLVAAGAYGGKWSR